MNTTSKKGLIFKSLSFVFCAIMFAFVLFVAESTTQSKAALKYCYSGTAMYVSDDGGCSNDDWNANVVSTNASSYYSYGTYDRSSLNSVLQAQIEYSRSEYSDSTKVRVIYVPLNTVITYNEVAHCENNKFA